MAADQTKRSYTLKEAAVATGLSEYTLEAAIRSGELRTVRPLVNGRPIRGKHLVHINDLDAWLLQDRQPT